MKDILIKNARIINEGISREGDVLIRGERIEKVSHTGIPAENCEVIDAGGLWLLPGAIDDQVHFREPGLTHKATIATESAAAVAGGVTSFMEMPNTIPNAVTQELLEDKYRIAALCSPANYSFFMGTTNDNYDELMRTDLKTVCGVKIFMGSSTGNMLVDDHMVLEKIFANCESLIATHCEDEATVHRNAEQFERLHGHSLSAIHHPLIRSREACYLSSSFASDLAKKHNTRLHILHITTAEEPGLFDNTLPLEKKRITSEVCVHHLTFNSNDYHRLGNLIKCNPAIKDESDRLALWKALNDDHLDIVATDHAPHTPEEKAQPYSKAPSGLPLVQHTIQLMLEHAANGLISVERVVEKMAHAPAVCFRVNDRGYIREGYFADLVLVDPAKDHMVDKNNLLYKCGWSPFEGKTFRHSIARTIVNGKTVFLNGKLTGELPGQRMTFNR